MRLPKEDIDYVILCAALVVIAVLTWATCTPRPGP